MKSIVEGILNSGITDNDDKAVVGVFVTFYWSGAMIGRFVGSYLTKIMRPGKVPWDFCNHSNNFDFDFNKYQWTGRDVEHIGRRFI